MMFEAPSNLGHSATLWSAAVRAAEGCLWPVFWPAAGALS